MKTETITWHELPQDGMPDADDTLLLETEDCVAEGWWDGEVWRWAESGGPVKQCVIAWAPMALGASAC